MKQYGKWKKELAESDLLLFRRFHTLTAHDLIVFVFS
jgi:hypothetical protein